MKGDFTRNTFDPLKHFTRVLMQQGRVQLDADWNEQIAILLRYVQTLAIDLIGPHGGPGQDGFKIDSQTSLQYDFLILPGHYYVDGILCENDKDITYTKQPDYPLLDTDKLQTGQAGTYLVYLVVWERHMTSIEDDAIREVALGGPDTATRARVVWQVKIKKIDEHIFGTLLQTKSYEEFLKALGEEVRPIRGQLKARAKGPAPAAASDPCITSPEARYRGAENQLYRVEIHKGGNAGQATFKWSRENGSVIFPIRGLQGNLVTLEHLGRDSRFGFAVGDWVEIVDDDYVLQGRAESLLQVDKIDATNTQVILQGTRTSNAGGDLKKHPLLRRWDHKEGDPTRGGLKLQDGAAMVVEGEGENNWLDLEDGVQVQFQKPAQVQPANHYRTGDYWLIPARTATGDVEWPGPTGAPDAVPPNGVEYHYAPLAIISHDGNGTVTVSAAADLRRRFKQLWA